MTANIIFCSTPTCLDAAVGTAEVTDAVVALADVPTWTYEVVNVYPHDPSAFTQGLLWDHGVLYESTGLYGRSSLRQVELKTGKVLQQVLVAQDYFAEGIALLNGRVFQLTWKNHKGFVYESASLRRVGEFSYAGAGWGLTHDGRRLLASDGSHRIRVIDPNTFAVERTIEVMHHGKPVVGINELEYIEGEIYANLLGSDQIIRIDPRSGAILGRIDLTGLMAQTTASRRRDVLNGIAYDPERKRIFVTGKQWPALFEVRFREKSRGRGS